MVSVSLIAFICMQATDATGPGSGSYESAFDMGPLYFLQSKCTPNSTLSFQVQYGPESSTKREIFTSSSSIYMYREQANYNSVFIRK
jgi:hypothetical protein